MIMTGSLVITLTLGRKDEFTKAWKAVANPGSMVRGWFYEPDEVRWRASALQGDEAHVKWRIRCAAPISL